MSADAREPPALHALAQPPPWATRPALFLAVLFLIVLTIAAPGFAYALRSGPLGLQAQALALVFALLAFWCLVGRGLTGSSALRPPDALLAVFGVAGAFGADVAARAFLDVADRWHMPGDLLARGTLQAAGYGVFVGFWSLLVPGLLVRKLVRDWLFEAPDDGDRLVSRYGVSLALVALLTWVVGRKIEAWGPTLAPQLLVCSCFFAGLALVGYATTCRVSFALALRRGLGGARALRPLVPRSRYRVPPPPEAESRAGERELYRRSVGEARGAFWVALILVGSAFCTGLVPGGLAPPEPAEGADEASHRKAHGASEDSIAELRRHDCMLHHDEARPALRLPVAHPDEAGPAFRQPVLHPGRVGPAPRPPVEAGR